MNTYTHKVRARCGKSIVEVLGNTVRFCALTGRRIVAVHYDPICCEVVVQL